MKKSIYILCLLFCSIQLNAQKNINFIISVDDNIVVGSLSSMKIIAITSNGTKEIINVDYCPGNLSLSDNDYKTLLDTEYKNVFLVFNYSEYQNQKDKLYNYEIDINKGWLKHYFFVLHIYNTTKKKYKKIFSNLEKKEYLYEFDYPGGSTKLIRKR